jgi:hypothetical protein
MTTIAQSGVECSVLGGVDTHKAVHVAAVIDDLGRRPSEAWCLRAHSGRGALRNHLRA